MSSSSIVHNDKKPITGAFELETKIRVIIQEVLAATVRKYPSTYPDSAFSEKKYKNFKSTSSPSKNASKLGNANASTCKTSSPRCRTCRPTFVGT